MAHRTLSLVLATSASLSMIAASSSANAQPRLGSRLVVHTVAAGGVAFSSATSRQATVSCTGNEKHTFVGATGEDNGTGGEASAVLGGFDNASCDEYDAIGGGYGNQISNSGAATNAFIGAGYQNTMSAYQAFIGAGNSNIVKGAISAVVGGFGNETDGLDSFVGAGSGNHAIGNGSAIAGGGYTYVNGGGKGIANQVAGADSFLGAGDQNSVAAAQSFIGSGTLNTVASSATYATILGGNRNSVTGEYASILGGFGNVASGAYGIVAGGDGDTAAGSVSFAAGYHADAAHNGSFVWSDYSSGSWQMKDSAANQFIARASGGVYLYSNEAATSGVKLGPGSGAWASLSDRNAKSDIMPLDDASILAKVSALPVSAWRYKSENGVRHVGPMAQDFYAAFHVGEDDRHITSIDEDGVALSAIKALDSELTRVRADNQEKNSEIAKLRSRFAILAKEVDALSTLTRSHTQIFK